ncbi:MAG: glycosyl transferase [Mucilaginibacter sp.]|nr:glycosyl transferase [Mucilaginibacter sp.]
MKIITTSTPNTQVKSIFNDLPKNILCFSHLRWDFVFQRPQQLLTRFAKTFTVFYMEEPVLDAAGQDYYEFLDRGENLLVVVPHIRPALLPREITAAQKNLLDIFMEQRDLTDYAFWYYTPMALEFSKKYRPELTVFDCMDELSAFKFAPEELKTNEAELLQLADVVFTGGYSLYEAKKNRHANIYAFPSSIDKEHFGQARKKKQITPEAKEIKLGFFGVIDERFDTALIEGIALARPDWQIELIGPVVKIDPATLPATANIHYLGAKNYQDLPGFMADWDVALIPFLLNESTRFISPTKTPEYLAAGLPVVSTAIRDVINPYGKMELVQIGADPGEFVAACEWAIYEADKAKWQRRVDQFLAQYSWDLTCELMLQLLQETVQSNRYTSIAQ